MNNLLIKYTLVSILILMTSQTFAGVPQTTMNCKSLKGNFTVSGIPQGEGFDVSIRSNDAVIRYVDMCDDTNCAKSINFGSVYVVDALYNKVFTIYFSNNENNFRGIFYALPASVKYKNTDRGYVASYKAIYFGDDPLSKEIYKESVKSPGIELICTQKNEL